MMKFTNIIVLPFLCVILICQLQGEDLGPIGTGRPGMANPTTSVSVGLYQFEMGLNSDMNDNWVYPIFFRTGVFSNTEIQVGYGEDLSVGILYGSFRIIDLLEQSIIITASLSENNYDLTSADLYMPFSNSEAFPFWGQVAGSFPNQGDPSFSYALATGGELSEKMGWFVEYFGDITTGDQGIDAGSTYLVNNTIQIDFSCGVSLSDTETKFVEVGFSFRLPE